MRYSRLFALAFAAVLALLVTVQPASAKPTLTPYYEIVKEAPYLICYEKKVANLMTCVGTNWMTWLPGFVDFESVQQQSSIQAYSEGYGMPADEILDGENPQYPYGFSRPICGLWGPWPAGSNTCKRTAPRL